MSVMEKGLHTIMSKPKGSSTDSNSFTAFPEFAKFLEDCHKGIAATYSDTKSDQILYNKQAIEAKLSELLEKLPKEREINPEHQPQCGSCRAAKNYNQALTEVREAIEKMLEELS